MTNLHNPEIDNDPREFLTQSFWVMGSFSTDEEFEIEEVQIGEVELPTGIMPFELEINGYTYERRD